MTQDLSIYSFRPRQRHLIISLVVIGAMGLFGFIRGILGAADVDVGLRPSASLAPQPLPTQLPEPADLPTVTALMPKAIVPEPPPQIAAKVEEDTVAATNTVAAAPAPPVVESPAAAPPAPPQASAPTPAAPPPPPPQDDGPIF